MTLREEGLATGRDVLVRLDLCLAVRKNAMGPAKSVPTLGTTNERVAMGDWF